jgi:Flp pilus assembly protein TadD
MRLATIWTALALAVAPVTAQAQDAPAYDVDHVRALITAGQYNEAQTILDAAFEKNGRDPMIFNLAAQVAVLGSKNYARGVSEETAAITLDPNQAEFYYERGLFRQYDPDLWMNEDMDAARADFSKAIELRPDFPAAYRERVQGLFRLRHDCEDTYYPARNAAHDSPNEPEILYILGVCEVMFEGDDKAAIVALTSAIDNGLATERVYEYRGYTYSRLGKKDLARADYEKASSIDPNVDSVQENLARLKLAPKRGLMAPGEETSWGAQMRADYAKFNEEIDKANGWRTAGGDTLEEQCSNLDGWWVGLHNAQIPMNDMIAMSHSESEKADLLALVSKTAETEAKASELMRQNGCP